MNKLQARFIEKNLETCLDNFRHGWGKHELHDHLSVILESIDTIAGEKGHARHPPFRSGK